MKNQYVNVNIFLISIFILAVKSCQSDQVIVSKRDEKNFKIHCYRRIANLQKGRIFCTKKISPRWPPLLFNISHQPCAIDDRIKGGYKKPRLRESVEEKGAQWLMALLFSRDGPTFLVSKTRNFLIGSYLLLISTSRLNERVRATSRLIRDLY